MPRTNIPKELLTELQEVAADIGCEVLQVEFHRGTLKLVLDRPEGVTLADCALVSRQASATLDAHQFGGKRYTLEVSSPGLDRPLHRPEDYERFVGKLVRLTFRDDPETPPRTIVGRLQDYQTTNGGVTTVVESDRKQSWTIPLEQIQAARLEVEF